MINNQNINLLAKNSWKKKLRLHKPDRATDATTSHLKKTRPSTYRPLSHVWLPSEVK